MNLNRIIRQFPDLVARVEALEARLAPSLVDSQPAEATIQPKADSDRLLAKRTLKLPVKESKIGHEVSFQGRARRETTGRD
jgi:hypothetical protein